MLDWEKEGDDEKVTAPLIDFLSEQPIGHIYLLSVDDDFLYNRCAVVANAQDYYEKILHNPHLTPSDLTFYVLLYAASKAYKRKTGKKFSPISAYNYETYSNKKGWQKEEI